MNNNHSDKRSSVEASTKLDSVQMLRALAVIAVALSHVFHELEYLLAGSLRGFDDRLFPGDFGVDLFFVISGFIIAYTTSHMAGSPADVLAFARKRIIRIVPLYWIMTTLMILVVVILPDQVNTATADWRQWLSSYFFLPYMRPDGAVKPVLALGWSLQYEMYFYALFALGLFLPRRAGLAAVAIAIAAVLAFNLAYGDHGAASVFYGQPLVLEFVAGMGIWAMYDAGWRVSRGAATMMVAAAILILAALPFAGDRNEMFRVLYYGIPGALLVVAAVLSESSERTAFGRIATAVGDASYATYLTHPFVIGVVSLVLVRLGILEGQAPLALIAIYLAATLPTILVVGQATHMLIDMPVTGVIRRIWPAPRRQVHDDTTAGGAPIGFDGMRRAGT